jgi:hypothetical protein
LSKREAGWDGGLTADKERKKEKKNNERRMNE